MNTSFLLGRLLFGGFFLYNGVNHLLPEGRAGLIPYAASKGVPDPMGAVTASGVVMALGGASILTGVLPKWGAALLGGALAAMTPTMHDFWNGEGASRQGDLIHFSKNVALLGAALVMISVDEPWPGSLWQKDKSE